METHKLRNLFNPTKTIPQVRLSLLTSVKISRASNAMEDIPIQMKRLEILAQKKKYKKVFKEKEQM